MFYVGTYGTYKNVEISDLQLAYLNHDTVEIFN